MSAISLRWNASALFKTLGSRSCVVELRRAVSRGWKQRVLKQETKKDVVFQYAGKRAHRSDRIYVWGCAATGALGKLNAR